MRSCSVLIAVFVLGCDGGNAPLAPGEAGPDGGVDGGVTTDGSPDDPLADGGIDGVDAGVDTPYADIDHGCAPVFSQAILPEYHLTIAPDQWAAMDYEFHNPQFTPGGSIVEPPYHPTQLHIVEGEAEHDPPGVMIRINGNTSWLQTIRYDDNPKMQFLIAFNKVDSSARFEGLRKVKLDMPRSDWTFLQQRVALAWMRGRAGIPAQCSNSARVYINGEYYGVYMNVEQQDKSFLTRNYGTDDNDGDLWKAGHEIKTNEDSFTWTRIDAFWDVTEMNGMDTWIDVDDSMIEWATEAVIGDSDGYNQGRPNYFVYDRPSTQQFVWLANDLDTVMDEDFLPPDTTPVFSLPPEGERRWERDWYHYLIALNDPSGRARYVEAMAAQLPKLDPVELRTWIDDWSAQIEDAVEADPHRSISMAAHADAIARMKAYPAARASYLDAWVDCWQSGGADADHDGFDMCHDCLDANAAVSPAATEVCDEIDNNCDGRVDDMDVCTQPTEREVRWQRVRNDVKAWRLEQAR